MIYCVFGVILFELFGIQSNSYTYITFQCWRRLYGRHTLHTLNDWLNTFQQFFLFCQSICHSKIHGYLSDFETKILLILEIYFSLSVANRDISWKLNSKSTRRSIIVQCYDLKKKNYFCCYYCQRLYWIRPITTVIRVTEITIVRVIWFRFWRQFNSSTYLHIACLYKYKKNRRVNEKTQTHISKTNERKEEKNSSAFMSYIYLLNGRQHHRHFIL